MTREPNDGENIQDDIEEARDDYKFAMDIAMAACEAVENGHDPAAAAQNAAVGKVRAEEDTLSMGNTMEKQATVEFYARQTAVTEAQNKLTGQGSGGGGAGSESSDERADGRNAGRTVAGTILDEGKTPDMAKLLKGHQKEEMSLMEDLFAGVNLTQLTGIKASDVMAGRVQVPAENLKDPNFVKDPGPSIDEINRAHNAHKKK